MSKIDPELFAGGAHSQDRENKTCPDCGALLHIRRGQHGPFLGCSAYPACHYMRPLTAQGGGIEKILPGTQCPACGHELAIRKGRFGLFIGCSQYPLCAHTEQGQATTETEPDTPVSCPQCRQGQMVSRLSRQGKTFWGCNRYPACRYIVNDRPVATDCPLCGWPVLVERSTRDGVRLCCPQKLCPYQSEL